MANNKNNGSSKNNAAGSSKNSASSGSSNRSQNGSMKDTHSQNPGKGPAHSGPGGE